MNGPPAQVLPALRQELELCEAASDLTGAQGWLIYDPVRHRYFSIGPHEARMLTLWQPMTAEDFRAQASQQLQCEVTEQEIGDLIYFLHANSLADTPATGQSTDYAAQQMAAKRSRLSHAIHSYLFVRIPLIRPYGFLSATAHLVAPFFTRTAFWTVLAMAAVGVYLVSRQWDTFAATFLHFLSLDGLLIYGVAIVTIKVLHELGHAYTAERHGVRVTSMGIAFMVMMPLLYTDVTNAWRLKSHRKRLQIAGAGIIVELALASIATFLWAFLPDGPIRSAAFVTATTSWLLSLAINLNPFMKFDGYYLLVDYFAIPNLQPRAFVLARWQTREWLFRLGHPPPDTFSHNQQRTLIAYAWGTWIYRLILFIGIALLVYHLFFKLLGLALFTVEIVWFIVLPVWRELVEWWKLRSEIMSRRRSWITFACVASLAAIALVPIRWSVTLPAVIVAQTDVALFPPRDAQIVTSHLIEGRAVTKGQILATLDAPELNHALSKVTLAIALLDDRLARIAGDAADLTQRTTIEQERIARIAERDGYLRQKTELVLRAAEDGDLRDLDPEIHNGVWLNHQHRIVRIVGKRDTEARAYANEDVLWRIARGDVGYFIPDDPMRPRYRATLHDIASAGVAELDITYLASVHGGTIASERDHDGKIRPRKSQYVLRLSLSGITPNRIVRGVIKLPGKPESIAKSVWRQIVRVLIRESGV